MPREPRQPNNGGSVKPEGTAIQPNPEHRDDEARIELFRQQTREALKQAQRYDGTEKQYHAFMDALVEVAASVKELPGLTATDDLTREAEAALIYLEGMPEEGLDIVAMMNTASVARDRILAEALDPRDMGGDDMHEQSALPIIVRYTDQVILRGGPMPEQGRSDSGGEWKVPEIQPRLQELLQILETVGVFLDDVVITMSRPPKDSLREVGYAAVEIPRVGKTILICNQVGEAMFILNGHFSLDTLVSHSKQELLERFPQFVRRIERRSVGKWNDSIVRYVSDEAAWSVEQSFDHLKHAGGMRKEKIDVATQVRIRDAVMQEYSAEEWCALTDGKRRALDIGGLGITAIARVFGITGSPIQRYQTLLEVGQAIYGIDNAFIARAISIESRTPDEWRAAVTAKYSVEQFLAMEHGELVTLEVDGKGLTALGSLFGVPLARRNSASILAIAAAIYGENNPDIVRRREIELRTPEQWKKRITELYTPQQWMDMGVPEKLALNIDGVGIFAIATMFGLQSRTVAGTTLGNIQLAEKIFGSLPEVTNRLKIESRTADEWRARLQQIYTPAQWLAMPITERQKFSVDGYGVVALIRVLGGTPPKSAGSRKAFFMLGSFIWPENNDIRATLRQITESPE